ncbi:MAG: hypothetical protein CMO01_21440 [Thalassobius sp.]|nr:hypothetical protein [Thalassovita sp.]
MQKISVTPNNVLNKIHIWYSKDRYRFDVKRSFIKFDNLDIYQQKRIYKKVKFRENELPALIYNLSQNHCIINTTERFIKVVEGQGIESIDYKDFTNIIGYVDVPTSIKSLTDNEYENDNRKIRLLSSSMIRTKRLIIQDSEEIRALGFRLKNNSIIYWCKLPEFRTVV